MLTIRDIAQPETLTEAYQILTKQRTNTVLGGCAFLRLGSKRIGIGIDLAKLNLDQITEEDDAIKLGAMTTLRQIETHPLLKESFCGVLPKAVNNIIGVQFRNGVTIGGSVYSKYGFSDPITALLALNAEVDLVKAGRLSLGEFLARPREKDILTHVIIPKQGQIASYQNLRISASDYPVLTAAVAKKGEDWRIVVGARPQVAELASEASAQLAQAYAQAKLDSLTIAGEKNEANEVFEVNEVLESILDQMSQELSFGSNARGSATYRQGIAKVLVRRGIQEVLAWTSK
ncbi:MAG: xanthine dehydrogenase family protein subunit M [Desulfitobacterium sp.]